MSKGIIVEIKEKYSIILKEDGSYIRIVNKEEMKVGKSIFFFEEDIYREKKKNYSKYGLIAVAALFTFIVTTFISKPKTEIAAYALVSLDINPSISIQLDENKYITGISGLNEDGKALDLSSIKGLSLEEGMPKIKGIVENYTGKKNNSVLIGYAALKDDNKEYEDYVKKVVKKNFKRTDVAYVKANNKEAEEAKKKGVSVGRYKAYLEEDELEDMLEGKSVDEIIEILKKNKHIIIWSEDTVDEIEDLYEDSLEHNNLDQDDDSDEEDQDDRDDSNEREDDEDDKDDKDDIVSSNRKPQKLNKPAGSSKPFRDDDLEDDSDEEDQDDREDSDEDNESDEEGQDDDSQEDDEKGDDDNDDN